MSDWGLVHDHVVWFTKWLVVLGSNWKLSVLFCGGEWRGWPADQPLALLAALLFWTARYFMSLIPVKLITETDVVRQVASLPDTKSALFTRGSYEKVVKKITETW